LEAYDFSCLAEPVSWINQIAIQIESIYGLALFKGRNRGG